MNRPHLDPFLLDLPGHEIYVNAARNHPARLILVCQCGEWRVDNGLAGQPLSELLLAAHIHHEVVQNRDVEFTSQDV